MADSSSSSSVNTNLPDVTSARSDHVPVQVTTVQLNNENYSRWSPAITMGIAGRGHIAYVNGRKVEPAKDSMAWDTWYLEDNQVLLCQCASLDMTRRMGFLLKTFLFDVKNLLDHLDGLDPP
ncbi:hypothetical protein EJ110_NYTH25478 [Nymphaea thermarum]|nr:hypothetical protein EJ110_NYTH25478 [Nymphaea thermarum]